MYLLLCGVSAYKTRNGLTFDAILELVKNGGSISDRGTGVGTQYIKFLKHKSIVVNGKSETPSETFTRLNGGVSAYKTQNGLTFAALCQLVKNGLSVINTSQYYIQYMLVHISLFSCTLLGYIHSM